MKAKRQNKILEIITKSNFGGAQKYVFELATTLDQEGVDVSVVFGGSGILKEKLEVAGINTFEIKSLGRDINILSDIKTFFALIKIIRRERPTTIHLNSSKIGGLGSVAGRLCRVPNIVFTIHGLAFNENRSWISKIIIKKFYWLIILLSHKSIAVSNDVKKQLTRNIFFKIFNKKIVVIQNAIRPIDFIEKNHARSLISEKIETHLQGRHIIATIAELHNIKGIGYLIQAANRIAKENSDVIFVVFGEGTEKENLEKMIRRFELEDKFFLLGFVDDAPKYLKGCNYFVLPSLYEGLGLSILEAKQAELPIAASNVGGIPEALKNYDKSEMFKTKNSEDIVLKIESLIKRFPVIERRFGSVDPEMQKETAGEADSSFEDMYRETKSLLL